MCSVTRKSEGEKKVPTLPKKVKKLYLYHYLSLLELKRIIIQRTALFKHVGISRIKLDCNLNLVFFQEFKLDGDITTQPFIFVSVDLVLMLSHLNANHASCIPWSQTQFLQIRAIGIKLKSEHKHKTELFSRQPLSLTT